MCSTTVLVDMVGEFFLFFFFFKFLLLFIYFFIWRLINPQVTESEFAFTPLILD